MMINKMVHNTGDMANAEHTGIIIEEKIHAEPFTTHQVKIRATSLKSKKEYWVDARNVKPQGTKARITFA